MLWGQDVLDFLCKFAVGKHPVHTPYYIYVPFGAFVVKGMLW